jgi:hypothetical protein
MVERHAGIGARSALELLHVVNGKAWEDSPAIFSQITKIGPKSIAVLAGHNVLSMSRKDPLTTAWNDLLQKDAAWIDGILSRGAPFGKNILEEASRLPRFSLAVT